MNELLRQEDIAGLLSTGAPYDEYGPEAVIIVNRVGEAESNAPTHKITREEIEAIINSVWKEMFGLSQQSFNRKSSISNLICSRDFYA